MVTSHRLTTDDMSRTVLEMHQAHPKSHQRSQTRARFYLCSTVGALLNLLLSVALSYPITLSLQSVAYAERSLDSLVRSARWEELFTEEGITLFRAERAGSSLPLLKGQATLPLNLYELMAVVEDAPRHPQWVYRMQSSKIFERADAFHLKAYVRFDFPWPSSDRDSVLSVEIKRNWTPHHEVWIDFKRVSDRRYPPHAGVVRVVQSRGYTRLRWLSPNQTAVVYVIDSDPGGDLPRWLVRWLARDLPLKVIKTLKRRVAETRGEYKDFLKRWDPRQSPQPDAPERFTLPGVSPTSLQ